MDAYSQLQQQFPLSPKKFWKKLLGSLIGCGLIAVIFLIFAAFAQDAFFWGIFSTIFLLLVAYLLLRAWYVKAYIRRYFYSASDDFVTIKKGVFAPAEIHVQYQKIQDVYVDQDILDRIMGLYDVHIASATVTSGIEAHIDGVEEGAADGLKTFLLDKIRGGGQSNAPQNSVASSSSQATPADPKPLDANQMISSTQYPIGSKWMEMQVVAAFINALWISIAIALLVGIQTTANNVTTWNQNWTLGFIAFVIIFLCQVIYNVLWKSNFHFAFLPDYIQLSTQVLAKSEQHMPYRTVQDVIVKQGIIERMFGLATVSIQNAAANQTARRSGWGGRTASQAINIPGQTPEGANKITDIVRSISLTRNSARTGL
jgi:putative membrane protein